MKLHRALFLVGLGLLIGSAALFWPEANQFLAVDSCLDSGGSYNYQERKCDYAQSHKSPVQSATSDCSILWGSFLSTAGLLCLLFGLRAGRSLRSNQAFNATARKRATR